MKNKSKMKDKALAFKGKETKKEEAAEMRMMKKGSKKMGKKKGY